MKYQFTDENTDGYTQLELDAFNSELVERVASLVADSDEYRDEYDALSDEIARR